LTFFPAIATAGFPAKEFAVAKTFGFSCLGFLVSLLLFLPLAIVCPSKMQRADAKMAWVAAVVHQLPRRAHGDVWSDLFDLVSPGCRYRTCN
jgi:hypothetical protein